MSNTRSVSLSQVDGRGSTHLGAATLVGERTVEQAHCKNKSVTPL
ncbi:hypothetical protein FOPG_10030 [Fusarium oxysporum f. sp. conglutinans race 2 54008]|uniref:Uncharacterized protein n=1 Tax=Fusarium oxysporum f. sp. conglutinans race 2 54008 TaxID=1089457 RepID=X0HEY2_FUSOX|nr:hypothetical protein FOPG_10030 [Fusarium oxysporum f. sp. conglutinans race 2 54008]